jgi:hypothetical protein
VGGETWRKHKRFLGHLSLLEQEPSIPCPTGYWVACFLKDMMMDVAMMRQDSGWPYGTDNQFTVSVVDHYSANHSPSQRSHVRGGQSSSRIRTVVPSPTLLSIVIRPPWASVMLRQIARPRPLPPVLADRAASTR